MNVATAFFYLFAFVCVASALMVVLARNPVHSVLYLILAFVNAAGLFMLTGAEFLALMLIVVYVGAVAVLFLFVVMMLDVDFTELRQGFLQYLPIGFVVGLIVLLELLLVVIGWTITADVKPNQALQIDPSVTNTEALGHVLYTHYAFFLEGAGLVLLVAMIGAIVLTLRHKEGVKRQNPALQSARTKAQSVEVRKVQPGQGI